VNYWNRLLGGSFSTALSVTRTTEDTSNLSTVGLLSVVNYSRRISTLGRERFGELLSEHADLVGGVYDFGMGLLRAVGAEKLGRCTGMPTPANHKAC